MYPTNDCFEIYSELCKNFEINNYNTGSDLLISKPIEIK